MRNNGLSLLRLLPVLLMSVLLTSSCYRQSGVGFSATHHYDRNYNFVVSSDSLVLYGDLQPADSALDSSTIYRGEKLVVAEIRMVSSDTIDSVWVKLARDQVSQGWIRECRLLDNVSPDDSISWFIDAFSDNHILLFMALLAVVMAFYGLRMLFRRDAYIVHFHDIESLFPTLLALLVATSATVYASIQNFSPESWRHFYFHPSLNPFDHTPMLGLFLVLIWSMVIVLIATLEDVFRRLPFDGTLLYLLGLSAVCAVNYVIFSIFTLYYVGYMLLVAYWWYALYKLKWMTCRYHCGQCGHVIHQLGKCPNCGAINE